MRRCSLVVVLCCLTNAAVAGAQTYTVRVIRDVPYLQGANDAQGKDTLDLYLPEGRRSATIRSRIGSDGDATTEQIIRFVSR